MVRRGEKIYFVASAQALLGEVRPAGMTDHSKEASLRGNRWVHALRVERESIYTVAGKKCHSKTKERINLPLSGKGECRTVGDRQVRPDQTETVEGQNGKRLVTASTIKGSLPCPEKRIEKQSIFTE